MTATFPVAARRVQTGQGSSLTRQPVMLFSRPLPDDCNTGAEQPLSGCLWARDIDKPIEVEDSGDPPAETAAQLDYEALRAERDENVLRNREQQLEHYGVCVLG